MKRYALVIIILIIFLFASSYYAFAAGQAGEWGTNGTSPYICTSSANGEPSCAKADVAAAYAAIAEDSTLVLGAGSAIWDTQLLIAKGFKLIGSGIDITTLVSDMTSYFIQVNPTTPADDPIIDISGITFDNNDTANGAIYAYNSGQTTNILTNIRVHHNKIKDGANHSQIYFKHTIYGLIDNNIFDSNNTSSGYLFYLLADDEDNWDIEPLPDYGSANFLFIEDNTITDNGYILSDTGEGIKYVARYNTGGYTSVLPSNIWNVHSPTGGNAGAVASEIYENTGFHTNFRFMQIGAQSVIYNNKAEPYGMSGKITLYDQNNDEITLRHLTNTYVWNNRKTSTSALLPIEIADGDAERLDENVDFWDDYGSGDTNFTYGIFDSRPVSPADNDCYWATDTKVLYRSVGADNWTEVYTPYTYPHPKQDEAVAPTIVYAWSSSTNGSYQKDAEINISLYASELISGTAHVTLDSGGTVDLVFSNSAYATGTYTVQDGESSADLTISSVTGTLKDVSTSENEMADFTVGTNLATTKDIVVSSSTSMSSMRKETGGMTITKDAGGLGY